jgi:hypothetical protein
MEEDGTEFDLFLFLDFDDPWWWFMEDGSRDGSTSRTLANKSF